MGVKISALSAASTLAGTELVEVVQTSSKKATVNQLSVAAEAYTETVLAASAAVDSVVAGYDFLMFDGATKKLADIDLMAAYIVGTPWSEASEADPAVSGDMILADRSGTIYQIDVDTLAAFALDSGAATDAVTSMLAGDDFFIYRDGVRKLIDVAYVASYVTETVWSSDAVTTLLSSDDILIGRSAATKIITLANLETQIVTDTKTTFLDISGLSAATLGATDEFLVNQSGVAKKAALSAIETKLWADFATYAGALTDAGTVADANKFYILQSGVPKYCTATEIATYITAELWAAETASEVVTADTILINHSGTMYEATVDYLATFVNASAQATVLDISGLDEATIGGTDYMLFCQTATGRQATVDDLAAYVHGEIATFTAALDPIATLADADLIYCVQGGVAKKLTASTLAGYAVTAANELPWQEIDGSKYTTTPTSTSTIAMTDTSDLAIGMPVKYTYSSTDYFGIVTSISTNASITIAGAPLDIAHDLSALWVDTVRPAEQVDYTVWNVYDGDVQDIFANIDGRYVKWQKAKAYLVGFSVNHVQADTGATQPSVNVKINGSLVSTEDSTHGPQLSTAGTWVDSSAVAINTSNYDINRGEAVEVRCTVPGTNGDAECLNISLIFVYE